MTKTVTMEELLQRTKCKLVETENWSGPMIYTVLLTIDRFGKNSCHPDIKDRVILSICRQAEQNKIIYENCTARNTISFSMWNTYEEKLGKEELWAYIREIYGQVRKTAVHQGLLKYRGHVVQI